MPGDPIDIHLPDRTTPNRDVDIPTPIGAAYAILIQNERDIGWIPWFPKLARTLLV